MYTLSTNCLRSLRLPTSAFTTIANKTLATKSSAQIDEDDELSERPTFLDDDNENALRRINRNKSGLLPQHRNMVHGKLPYKDPQSWIHLSEKYQKKMFGRYGSASGVDPRICFPTQSDLEEKLLKERVYQPNTLQQMMEIVEKEKQQKLDDIMNREANIAEKLNKLEQWKKELRDKSAKKEADAQAAKERKERLVEEVRRHFGFKVDPREDRFKEMLLQKEREQKRKDKETKRKAKEDKMLEKLVKKNDKPAVQEEPKDDKE